MKSKKRTTLPVRARTNWIERGDGRTKVYRALREKLRLFTSQYGVENISPAKAGLLTRLVHLEMLIEQMENQMHKGKTVNLQSYAALVDRYKGLLTTLGLERVAKTIRPLAELVLESKQ